MMDSRTWTFGLLMADRNTYYTHMEKYDEYCPGRLLTLIDEWVRTSIRVEPRPCDSLS
jgi:hypothetical protein